MNLLDEVLSSVETISLDTIYKQMPALMNQTDLLRENIMKYMDQIYLKGTTRPKRITELLRVANVLIDTSTHLKIKLNDVARKDITEVRTQVTKYQQELTEVDVMLALSSDLCKIHETLMNTPSLLQENNYVKVIEELTEIETGNLPNDNEIVTALHSKVCLEKVTLVHTLDTIIRENFKCEQQINQGVTENSITIGDYNEIIKDAIMALSIHHENITPLDNIVRFLWENMLTPIVQNADAVVMLKGEQCKILTVTIKGTQKPSYGTVFGNLIKFVSFIHSMFNYVLHDGKTTIEYIGENIRDNLSELIIKQCLDDTIPSTPEGLQSYSEVIQQTQFLQRKLVESGLFTEEMTSILDHANNVDVLFINKKCHSYNQLANDLMRKDLHDVVVVGKPIDTTKFSSSEFPQCSISKSVVEILVLVEKILEKASMSQEVGAGRLFTTAKNILFKYGPLVTEFHQKLLQTIPQQVAIFYNNCKFINHNLSEESKWCELLQKLPKTLGVCGGNAQFDLISQNLQASSNQLFQSYIQEQERQIEELVKSTGIGSVRSCMKLEPSTEKCIRQSLRQQELLKTVWQKILNYHDYNETMGFLLNTLCKSLITATLTIEDISSEAAEQMVDLFKLVMTRGPKLFTEPKEINMFVETWHRLSELVFVLNTNLLNINERWADGKGPLALHFTPNEMRELIRALFENSDRRAAVLEKIRDC